MANEGTCAICFDVLCYPKLLNCLHTFCEECLKRYIEEHKSRKIVCPLCRKVSLIPEIGVSGMFYNYFVRQRRNHDLDPPACDICSRQAAVEDCGKCSQHVCRDCRPSHICSDEQSVGTSIYDGAAGRVYYSNGPKNEPEEEIMYQIPIYILPVRTLMEGSLFTQFDFIPSNRRLNCMYVSNITRLRDGKIALTQMFASQISIYNMDGYEVNRIHTTLMVSGLTCISNERYLVVSLEQNAVLEIDQRTSFPKHFASTGKYKPMGITSFDDDRVVVSGTYMSATELTSISRPGSHGVVLMFNSNGHQILNIKGGPHGYFSSFPDSIHVNSRKNIICVFDRQECCIYIFNTCGELVYQYCAVGNISQTIYPFCACLDLEGNILCYNLVDRLIHVVDGSGAYVNYIMCNGTFECFTKLAIDSSGKIWTSDRDGCIRIYNITRFRNLL